MRALFRPFALHAAYTPIETIVFFCIIGTLAYFHILSAIKHSAFLDPSLSPTSFNGLTWRPAHALFHSGEWVAVREGKWAYAVKSAARTEQRLVEIQQLVFGVEGFAKGREPSEHNPSLAQAPLSTSTLNLTKYLTSSAFRTAAGHSYPQLCYRPATATKTSSLNHSAEEDSSTADTEGKEVQEGAQTEDAECFTFQQASSRSFVQTFAFRPSVRDEWAGALLSPSSFDTTTPSFIHGHAHHQQHNTVHGLINSHAHALGLGSAHANAHPRVFQDESGVRFEVVLDGSSGGHAGGEAGMLEQMRNGNFWIAYAARALVVRFWDLAKKADSLDILLILAGYILMHTTFYLLLIRSRSLGSSFWLPLAILSAAVLSLLLALPIAMALKIPIDPVALTEALPFLVCTVGFDKPLRLARAVFLHPHLSAPVRGGEAGGYPTTASTSNTNGAIASAIASANSVATLAPPTTPMSASTTTAAAASSAGQLKPAPKIITESLTLVYAPIIRDYVLEIAVLTVGAYSKVGGLAEVCALAALILAVDCLLLCTYLAAILGVMVEVRRIKTVRAYTRSRSNSVSSSVTSASNTTATRLQSVMARPSLSDLKPKTLTLKQRVKRILLGGEKGSGLLEYERGYGGRGQKMMRVKGAAGKGKMGGKEGNENPVARLKLLLIATFMTLHTLNLITPLTPSRHTHSSSSSAMGAGLDGQVNIRKVDITAPALRTVLAALQIQDNAEYDGTDENTGILVKVHPPIYVRALSPTFKPSSGSTKHHASSSSSSAYSPSPSFASAGLLAQQRRSTSERLDAFMSAWTRLVGDPILSKWIVVILAISVVLNGYLLKGIAAGVVGAGVGGIRAFGVRGAVRFEEEEEVEHAHVASQEKAEEIRAEADVTPKADVAPAATPAAAVRTVVETAVVPAPAVSSAKSTVGTFTLEDVDRRLEQARANSRRMTVTSASVTAAAAASFSSSTTTTTGSSSASIASDIPSSSSSATSAGDDARPLAEILDIFEHGPRPLAASLALLTDEEVILLVQQGRIQPYALEKALGMEPASLERAVRVRRAVISRSSRTQTLEHSDIPLTQYDYSRVYGACCENVVGYIPLPLGIAGPLNIDGQSYLIPMATAEGTLVASTSRGCKALNAGGGVTTVLLRDAMTRGPAVEFDTITEAARCVRWIESTEGAETLRRAFEGTSRFAKLVGGSASGVDGSNSNGGGLKTALAGRTLYIRFRTTTGDAMGMNMISKGTEKALAALLAEFPTARILALSGNYCTDKKAAAINWIEGRGKSIVAECVVPGHVVEKVLKTSVRGIVELNTKKNLIGSAMAGVVGGFNAHAANIVAAVFLATGQDPAQVVESAMCLTGMEATNNDRDLLITVTMPSIEVGTVGGGTVLSPQAGVLSLLGIKGAHPSHPGHNAQQLARIVASAVMAGELSLMSALAAGDLIRAHMTHNRSVVGTPAVGVFSGGEGHGVLVGGEEGKKALAMTPSLSTTSLPSL